MTKPSTPTPLDLAVQEYRDSEAALKHHQEIRDSALFHVLTLLPGELKADGTVKCDTEYFDISATGRMNRKLDQSKLDDIQMKMRPGDFHAMFKDAGYKLSLAGLRAVQDGAPEQYAIAAGAITATPGTPSLKIKLKEKS